MAYVQKLIKNHGSAAGEPGLQAPQHPPVGKTGQPSFDFELAASQSANNTPDFRPTSAYFPANYQLAQQCSFPLGFFYNPFPDDSGRQTDMRADKLPRCQQCKAYMNRYNKFVVNGNNFRCFLCSHQTQVQRDYFCELKDGIRKDAEERAELSSTAYTALQPDFINDSMPKDLCFVFLIDLSKNSADSQMLFYAVSVMKEVMAKPEFDQHVVLLYTFDTNLHCYSFEGGEASRIVLGEDVQGLVNPVPCSFGTIREAFFGVLDDIEQIAQSNTSKSCFFNSFQKVFAQTRRYSPKYIVLQSSDNFLLEDMGKTMKPAEEPLKSVYESSNKGFFNRFVKDLIDLSASMSMFVFASQFRNLKVLGDTFKLSSSSLFLYGSGEEHKLRFYYELYAVLDCEYLVESTSDIILSRGWTYSGTYSNMYRLQTSLTFRLAHLERRRCVGLHITHMANSEQRTSFGVQIITRYSRNGSSYITVTTQVVPLTMSLDTLYRQIDYPAMSALNLKISISSLRISKNIDVTSSFYKTAAAMFRFLKRMFKTIEAFPPEAIVFFEGCLSFLKSRHANPESVGNTNPNQDNTVHMDKLIAERNFLQGTMPQDVVGYFSPYLFRLSDQPADCCNYNSENTFVYPETVSLEFESVKEGIFLMDASTELFLFVAKKYNARDLSELFGIDKIFKNTLLTEAAIQPDQGELARKATQLIAQLRASKPYQYAPLLVAVCGSGSAAERQFYMRLTNQQYAEHKQYNLSWREFAARLEAEL